MITNDHPSNFLTVYDIAEHFHVSTRTVRRWIAMGTLPVHRFGRSVRIDRQDLVQFIEAHRDT